MVSWHASSKCSGRVLDPGSVHQMDGSSNNQLSRRAMTLGIHSTQSTWELFRRGVHITCVMKACFFGCRKGR